MFRLLLLKNDAQIVYEEWSAGVLYLSHYGFYTYGDYAYKQITIEDFDHDHVTGLYELGLYQIDGSHVYQFKEVIRPHRVVHLQLPPLV